MCSGGVYASLDLSLYLVEKICGHEIALQTAKSLLVGMPRHRQSGYAVTPLSRPHSDQRIKAVEDFLYEHVSDDVSIETLAGRAGMGPRNFIRRFKAATGRLPRAYVQMLRVWTAKDLLERGAASVQAVSSNDRLRGRRVLPRAVQAPYRNDAGGISPALRGHAHRRQRNRRPEAADQKRRLTPPRAVPIVLLSSITVASTPPKMLAFDDRR